MVIGPTSKLLIGERVGYREDRPNTLELLYFDGLGSEIRTYAVVVLASLPGRQWDAV